MIWKLKGKFSSMAKITAVIDIGSNSARMAIFRRTSRFGFHLVFECKSKVRISEGSYENGGFLQEEPISRALNALKNFSEIAKAHKARKLLCVATSAVRDAPNRNEFISLAKKQTKIQIKVIDGSKEAFFGAVACSNLLHKKNGITIDIGGGSTECAIIENGRIRELISLNLGTIRLKELFSGEKLNVKKAREFINNELLKLPPSFKNDNIFGIGGSIRALSKLIMKKENYAIPTLHGFEYNPKKYLDFFSDIINSDIKKLKNFAIPQEREDNIREGALILSSLISHFGANNIITSGVGVREGVFLSDLLRGSNYTFPHNFNPSLKSLLDRFYLEKTAKLQSIKSRAGLIFDVIANHYNIDLKYRFHLQTAAMCVGIGDYLNFYASHEHSSYFLLNALNYGYSHSDRAIICLLVKYSNKKIPKDDEIAHISELMPDILVLQYLSYILSIAESLCFESSDIKFSLNGEILLIIGKISYLAKEKISALNKPENIFINFVESL